MRPRGTGSITPHQGGFRARLPVEGKTKDIGVFATVEEAEIVLNRALLKRAATPGASATVQTFATFGRRVLDMREGEGIRSVASERNRWKNHIETCDFASKAVRDVTSADIADLLQALGNKTADDKRGRRKISRKTVQRCKALLSAIFSVAVQREMRPTNPCVGIKVRRDKDDEEIDEDGETIWDWLRGDEQQAFLAHPDIPRWFKVMTRAAWGIGWRQGEQWNHELRDVHFARTPDVCACGAKGCLTLKEKGAHVFIRWGKKGKRPKSGKVRRVHLFGEGLAAMMEWLDLLPTYASENPSKLTFPTQTGCRRQTGAPQRSVRIKLPGGKSKVGKAKLLPEMLALIGVDRNIRWHDLRHTCASSLVSGTWGRAWKLEEVRDMLGHSSITVTEKYAHLSPEARQGAANGTPGHGVILHVMGGGIGGSGVAAISSDFNEVGRAGLEPATYGLKVQAVHEELLALRSRNATSMSRATEVLRLMGEGRHREALALAVTAAIDDGPEPEMDQDSNAV